MRFSLLNASDLKKKEQAAAEATALNLYEQAKLLTSSDALAPHAGAIKRRIQNHAAHFAG